MFLNISLAQETKDSKSTQHRSNTSCSIDCFTKLLGHGIILKAVFATFQKRLGRGFINGYLKQNSKEINLTCVPTDYW